MSSGRALRELRLDVGKGGRPGEKKNATSRGLEKNRKGRVLETSKTC